MCFFFHLCVVHGFVVVVAGGPCVCCTSLTYQSCVRVIIRTKCRASVYVFSFSVAQMSLSRVEKQTSLVCFCVGISSS